MNDVVPKQKMKEKLDWYNSQGAHLSNESSLIVQHS